MLAWILAVGPKFMNPEFWLEKAGASAIWMVTAIIFAESGLFFGFFLPGDSLLFLTGFLTSDAAAEFAQQHGLEAVTGNLPPLPVVCLMLFVAAVVGDQVGYIFGRERRPGPVHPAELAVLQAGVRHQGPRLPREERAEDDLPRPVRADRADLRPDRRRRGQDALPHLRHLQRPRRPGVGGRHHLPRPLPRQHRVLPRQHRVRDHRRDPDLAAAGVHRGVPRRASTTRTRASSSRPSSRWPTTSKRSEPRESAARTRSPGGLR